MRGKRHLAERFGYFLRIIPAHAGQTCGRGRNRRPAPDHPRACGANVGSCASNIIGFGSSPRMRGKQRPVAPKRVAVRIIPAHAGQTSRSVACLHCGTDHPRACGANSCDAASGRIVTGSSPRMRGKPAAQFDLQGVARIIPAHAGQTPRCRSSYARLPDHPRACGANHQQPRHGERSHGSSPRMRGKPRGYPCLFSVTRIIPAHAGQTWRTLLAICSPSDHPRACGANAIRPSGWFGPDGSSPRMRGKRSRSPFFDGIRRIIPAHAGQTMSALIIGSCLPDHPRACGANSNKGSATVSASGSSPRMRGKPNGNQNIPTVGRIIPAHAGQTAAYALWVRRAADHPRACGANCLR